MTAEMGSEMGSEMMAELTLTTADTPHTTKPPEAEDIERFYAFLASVGIDKAEADQLAKELSNEYGGLLTAFGSLYSIARMKGFPMGDF